MLRLALALILSLAVWCLPGWAEEVPTQDGAQAEAEKQPELKRLEIGRIKPLHSCGRVMLAGQPSAEEFALLKEKGIKTVINLRKPKETDWDEAPVVTSLGMKYVHVPFSGKKELTDEVFDRVLKVLREEDQEEQPVMFHCASANRVGAIWFAHRMLDGELSEAEALEEAKTVGLRSPDYLERAREYVADKKAKEVEAPARSE